MSFQLFSKVFKIDRVNASGRRLRGDIQGLRALAVGLVILNHLWPARLAGGYVGVDVFFVISGFLITSHLNRELDKNGGRVRLVDFYAKRVRRLLPVAFFVICLSLVAVWVLLPFSQWVRNAKELVAATFYTENLYLAYLAVDYHANDQSATVAQHYWSLSVEEQFYLLWPILLMLFYYLAKKLNNMNLFPVFIGVFGFVSFVYCVYFTLSFPAQAYFFTPVRFWEFSVGALIAVMAPVFRKTGYVNTVLAIIGWAAIGVSAVLFEADTVFPGFIALVPVVGTGLVIVAGIAGDVPVLHRFTDFGFIRLVGDISYSLYLWHWPLILFTPYVIGQTLNYRHKLVLLVVVFVLSYLSKTYIEDKGIRSRFLRKSSIVTFVSMVCVMGVIGVSGLFVVRDSVARESDFVKQSQAKTKESCFGAQANNKTCKNLDTNPYSVVMTEENNGYHAIPKDCKPGAKNDYNTEGECNYSKNVKGSKDKPTKVIIVGDSHIQHWVNNIVVEAKNRNWDISWMIHYSCPVADVEFLGDGDDPKPCMDATKNFNKRILEEKPDIIFYSNFSRIEPIKPVDGKSEYDTYVDRLPVYWQQWVDMGAKVINIADIPYMSRVHEPHTCLEQNKTNPLACALNRGDVLGDDPIVEATKKMNNKNVHLLDFNDYICDKEKCRVSVGGIPVYYDTTHLNRMFVDSMQPYISDKLDKILGK